jgi:hypothetical protein
VHLGKVDRLRVPEDGGGGPFLVPDVGNALEKQERQDVRLPIVPVDRAAAKDFRAFPEMRFKI